MNQVQHDLEVLNYILKLPAMVPAQKALRIYPYRIMVAGKEVELVDVYNGIVHLMFFLLAADFAVYDAKSKAIKMAQTVGTLIKGNVSVSIFPIVSCMLFV